VWGAADPKTGAGGSVVDILGETRLNHHTQVVHGVLAEASGRMLQGFFAERRAQARTRREAARGGADAGDTVIPAGEATELGGFPPTRS
jgi:tRNA(adenine34) deaminase